MALSKAEKSPNCYPKCILLAKMSNDREKCLSWNDINNVRMISDNKSVVCKYELRIITLFTQNL